MTKDDKPVGVMNGGDSGTFGERCRRLRGETDPRRRSPWSIRQLGSSASVPGEFAPVADSDWHDRCLTHRDFCENRLVDVKVRPDELVGGERQQLAKPQFLHAIATEHPEEPQRRRALV